MLACLLSVLLLARPTAGHAAPESAAEPQVDSAAGPTRVLLVYAANRLIPAVAAEDEAFRSELTALLPGPITFHTEFLEPAVMPAEQQLLAELLEHRYRARKPDLVATMTSVGLRFVMEHRARLFPGTPVVFMSVDRGAAADIALGERVTGTWLQQDWAGTLDLALRLQPATRRVTFVSGAGPRDQIWLASARRGLAHLSGGLVIDYLPPMSLARMLAHVAALPHDAVVLLSPVHRDGAGQEFIPHTVARRIAAAAAVPTYAVMDPAVGIGVVGGRVVSPAEAGRQAARLAARLLAGETPEPAPTTTLPLFDWRQLERWGLDASRLPPDSVLRFKTPSAWETYRWYIGGAVVVVLAQGVLIGGLLIQHTRRRQAERARRQAEEQARQGRDELAHALRTTTLGELSAAIAHEMNQPLAAIVTNAQASRRMLNGQAVADDEIAAALGDITADAMRASRMLQRLRLLSRKSHSEYRALDLSELIDDTIGLLRGDIRLKQITVDVTGPRTPLPRVLGDPIQLQQVFMNLLINAGEAIAAVPEGPRRIAVAVAADEPGSVRVSVRDTGVGLAEEDLERVFAPFVTSKSGGLGMGLSISRSIVEAHGGRIWATREPAGGAGIHVVLPCVLDEDAGHAGALDLSSVPSATA